VCVYMRGRERGGGSVSVARALVVVARRLPFEEEKRKVVVVVAVKKKEEGRERGRGGARQVPRRCRSPTFRRSCKGARLACVFGSTTCGRTWKCERGRNGLGEESKTCDSRDFVSSFRW
jgi:hypothetical protein